MALRLRRGTDAERQIITPVEGELVYVTDTKELFVGDGSTVGGLRVTGEIPDGINGLTDVDAALPQDGDILVYDTASSEWEAVQLLLEDLPDVNAAGILDGQVLAWDNASSSFVPANNIGGGDTTFVGDLVGNILADDSTIIVNGDNKRISANEISATVFQGDLVGSVFADDSSTIIDSIRRIVSADEVNATSFLGDLTGDVTGNLTGDVTGELTGNVIGTLDGDIQGSVFGDDSTLIVDGTSNSVIADTVRTTVVEATDGNNGGLDILCPAGNSLRVVSYEGIADNPTTVATGDTVGSLVLSGYTTANNIQGVAVGLIAQYDETADLSELAPNSNLIFALGQNSSDPAFAATLDYTGNFSANSITPGTYADTTARDAAITSPVAGQMVFLTDGDGAGNPKFQGYDGSAWVNLN